MRGEMTAVAMGVHVLDVLVRPVEAIPEGQGGQLVDQIRVTAAGSAGGTAITLAKLGAGVSSAGAIGTDAVGDMLIHLLERDGVDTSHLVRRCRALVHRGVGCIAATRGADGVVLVDADGVEAVPAFAIEVVDTTGCGDSFSAGFLRGL